MCTNIMKNQIFFLGEQKVIATEDIRIGASDKGYFILNFWEQCSYEDIDTIPVVFVYCRDNKKVHELKRDNIIIGNADDICLI